MNKAAGSSLPARAGDCPVSGRDAETTQHLKPNGEREVHSPFRVRFPFLCTDTDVLQEAMGLKMCL